MIKKIILILILNFAIILPVFAEKIPVRITPVQVISTHHDEIEVGDWIKFEVVNDVYSGDNLYVSKGTKIVGIVDFVHPNGWAGDGAQIKFKKFVTTDVNNKKVIINYPLDILNNGEMATSLRQTSVQILPVVVSFVGDLAACIRGAEIFIEPDTTVYNLFLTR